MTTRIHRTTRKGRGPLAQQRKDTEFPDKVRLMPQIAACQSIGSRLLEDVVKVCEEHGIAYFLDMGTLLGAFRYGGWIPWDDDVDIGMLREDYERLLLVPEGAWPPYLRLSDPWSDDAHVTSVPRIIYRPSGLDWVERCGVKPPERQHIVVDIYLADRGPANKLVLRLWLAATRLLQVVCAIRGTSFAGVLRSKEGAGVKTVGLISLAVSRLLPRKAWRRIQYRLQTTFRNGRTGDYFFLNHPGTQRGIPVQSSWVRDLEKIEFSGRAYAAPASRPYLRAKYGEGFNSPPPFEARRPHHYEGFWADDPWQTPFRAAE